MKSAREVATEELMTFLAPRLHLNELDANRLEELLETFVDARAEHEASRALDREFSRGDYRCD